MTPDLLWHLLLALTAVLVAGRVLGSLFRFIGQPPVIGEVVAGILLGPSLLGSISPDAYAFLLPSSIAPSLGLLSQLGVALYMFLIGVELDTDGLRGQLQATVTIAQSSIVVPFVLGGLLAMVLYQELAPAGVPLAHFALFLGVAMSITAFPVLARILADAGLSRHVRGRAAGGRGVVPAARGTRHRFPRPCDRSDCDAHLGAGDRVDRHPRPSDTSAENPGAGGSGSSC